MGNCQPFMKDAEIGILHSIEKYLHGDPFKAGQLMFLPIHPHPSTSSGSGVLSLPKS